MPLPDEWLVLTLHIPTDDPLRDLAAEGLLALGGLSVVEEGESLTTYVASMADPQLQVGEAETFLGDWLADDCPPLSWRLQDNQDWEREWRRGLEPRKVSARIVVKPTWTEWLAAPDEIVIDIDPQMAFGTGEHATTRGCLRLLDEAQPKDRRILDVGSGSAILSIAAALLGAREVIAIEYDADANINARENIDHHGVGQKVTLHEALAAARLLRSFGSFDIILANILSGVIHPLLPAIARVLRVDGTLIVSGILQRERANLLIGASEAGFALRDEIAEEEWWSAALTRVPAMNEVA
jgi:ribosomal protein L11 methyltransferase